MIDIDKGIEVLKRSLSNEISKLIKEEATINELLEEDSIAWAESKEKEYCEQIKISKHEYIYFELLINRLDIPSAYDLKERFDNHILASKFNMYLQLIKGA